MRQGTQEIKDKVARKPKFVDVDENLWLQMKSAAALKNITISEAIEDAIGEWLAE